MADIVPQDEWSYVNNLRKYRPDYIIHGDDWKEGPARKIREDVFNVMREIGGEVIEIPYTQGINSSRLAAGHYLATGHIPCVYMQNSGEGNAINPLASLTDSEVYNIPVLLVIGWRGEPGVHDEPQHVKQGEISTSDTFRLCSLGAIDKGDIRDFFAVFTEALDKLGIAHN